MLYQKNSVISNVIGEILKNTVNGQRLQIDPSPKWFMNTMSGLEELLVEAAEGLDESTNSIIIEPDFIKSDGYTCGECGKNCTIKEDINDNIDEICWHQICLDNTPNVISVKPVKKATFWK